MDDLTVVTAEWLVSTANTSLFNSTQEAGYKDTVDEYAQQVIQRFQYVNLAVRLTMGFIAFSTNLLTIVAIASFEYLRSATNYLIAYLAFADMVAGINSVLLVTNYLTPMSDCVWTRMCALETSLHYIAAERICLGKVFNSFQYTNYTFYAFSIMIIMINTRIAYIAYQQKKAIALGQMSEVNKNQNKITKMLSMVLGVYYFCYMPQITVLVLQGFFPGATYGVIIERISSWFWWVNSWSNPPIYAWKNTAFNKAFRSLLGMRSATVDAAVDKYLICVAHLTL